MEAMIVRMSRKRRPFLRSSEALYPMTAKERERPVGLVPPSKRNDLARIHDVVRIDGPFQDAHQVERRRAMLDLEVLHLLLADAVLARAGALHGERPPHQPVDEGLAGLDLRRIVRVHKRLNMEIAVAHMADDGRDEAAASMSRFVSSTHSASREIGTQTSVATDCAPGRRPLAAQ